MKIYTVSAQNFMMDGGASFGVVPKGIWNKKYPADENNMCNFANRCLLVIDGDRKILIDTGVGNKQDEKFLSFCHLSGVGLMESLEKTGVAPDEITDVVFSHLHYDHCGGAVKFNDDRSGYELTFKNANYWVSKAQWDCAMNPNIRENASFLDENLLPIRKSGNLRLIENDMELYPNFSVRLYDGHTDGQVIPFINYNGKTLVYVSDMIPTHVHVPIVYAASYDIRPLTVFEDKQGFLKEAAENNYTLLFEHDIDVECCTVKNTPRGIKVKETFKFDDIK